MSAFALRKKLLAQTSQVPSSVDQAEATAPVIATDSPKVASSSQKKTRKSRATRPTSAERHENPDPLSGFSSDQGLTALPASGLSQADQASPSLSPLSLDGEDGQDGEDDHISGPVQPVNLSSFRPSRSNYHKKGNGVLQLKLKEGERLVVFGSYGVRVGTGEVTLYGATLGASQGISWVHAPLSHALPVIRCTADATLELHSHPHSQELKDLTSLSPLFRKLWLECPSSSPPNEDIRSSETFQILYTSEDGPKKTALQDLKSPAEWNREIARLVASKSSTPSSYMITGPKSSGKSTFGKVLTNRLLTSTHTHVKRPNNGGVVVLDLDPGQPEYCGLGQLALILVTKPVLSPPFCRPLNSPGIQIIRSHALASLSPASDPDLYTEMALDLIAHYRNAFGTYPLVINTPGWIQGTGLELLVSLIGEIRPSEVIYMSQTGPSEAVEALEGASSATHFSTLPSQPSQNILRSAIDLRSMQTMAYFHAELVVQHDGEDHLRWFHRPLTAMAPWRVRFRGANSSIFGVLCYDFQTQPDLIADAINGAVLVAVEVESVRAFRDIERHQLSPDSEVDEDTPGSPMEIDAQEPGQVKLSPLPLLQRRITTLTAEGIPFIDTSHGLTLDPRYSRSLGLVLVRGIDVENGDLHLLCPITTSQVEAVHTRGGQIVLVSGKFDPPSWAYTEDLYFQSRGELGDANDSANIDNQPESIEVHSEGTGLDNIAASYSSGSVPWIEVLARNQKRGAGSKVWRVRRDLGRVGNSTD
ncbi:hypothetical protein F4802DRAFT_615368 [Xylaria palmicola]|nr:hypothetical protein F4802DRAFT_615368 [Xylaria palmicola]